jgi:hypothetical protein
MAAAAGSCWEAAERHFAVAHQHAKQMQNRLEEIDLQRLRAHMLLDRGGSGDRAQAQELLEEALINYRKFGMPSYIAEVERMLRQTRN